MEEKFSIVVFGSGSRASFHVTGRAFRTAGYSLAFTWLLLSVFFCDYVQIKKRSIDIDRTRQEIKVRTAQLQTFSDRIRSLEERIIRLNDLDTKINATTKLQGFGAAVRRVNPK
jgi:hypothetical protein